LVEEVGEVKVEKKARRGVRVVESKKMTLVVLGGVEVVLSRKMTLVGLVRS
jgi:hypothetical protein